jgi:hypothetical protein
VLRQIVYQVSGGYLDGFHSSKEKGHNFVDDKFVVALEEVGIDHDGEKILLGVALCFTGASFIDHPLDLSTELLDVTPVAEVPRCVNRPD